jgi:methylmalonyl-CoA mutase cobalamin-binding domain/chain
VIGLPGVPPRIVLAKIGLDTHDRGIRLIAAALVKAGCEVEYLGPYRSPEEVASAAVQQDAQAIGTSFLDGGQLGWTADLLRELRARGAEDMPVLIGGIVPDKDAAALLKRGVYAVVPPGTPVADIVALFLAAASGQPANAPA